MDNRVKPHVPVLLAEVIHALAPKGGGKYIDGTVGAGGHAEALLNAAAPDGKLLGLDGDAEALRIARETLRPFGERAILIRSNFTRLEMVAAEQHWIPCDGALLDFGLSSMQLANPARGFSFQSETLDMRMDDRAELTAAEIVNTWDEAALADLIYLYGEERLARKIARLICEQRPFHSAQSLANAIERGVGRRGKIHPATRAFQALRLAVNHELENIETVLPQLERVVGPGGRVALITFHSLEDRIVKNFFKTNAAWRNLTKHPLQPTYQQTRENPRARSAKLRVAERL
ncbi:MAG: 16S rRNA (cytosine(1402)-N(4))-methyltransferase [Chloroflexi bacterium UTCFX4]|jgi:16S rRNA (cytosine1402-N4)-methyltransferase|nr:MAG: 16S rRNA (cytosine(1402)-N(4))-methyltransferase [Chloroflexi bacterium UTCFX4]